MTTSTRRVVGIAVALLALLVPSLALATPGPVAAPSVPGAARTAGAARRPRQARRDDAHAQDHTGHRRRRHADDDLRRRASGEQGRQPHLEHGDHRLGLDARPDSVDYLGRKATKFPVLLAKAHTDATGAFTVKLAAPQDWGGLHDIYAVVDGLQVAKGGFLIARHATMTPKRGPIGTPITITYSGLGSSSTRARCRSTGTTTSRGS